MQQLLDLVAQIVPDHISHNASGAFARSSRVSDCSQAGQQKAYSEQDTEGDTQQLLVLVAQIVPLNMSHNAGGLVRMAGAACI